MERQIIVDQIIDAGLIAIIRARSRAGLEEVCGALIGGGVRVMEVTMTTPGALEVIAAVANRWGNDCLIGVGSVLDVDTTRRAIDSGACFVVAPTFDPRVMEVAHAAGAAAIPGALSPTEILAAAEYGADLVKVFPANHFGPRYFKDLLAPLPHLKLAPTGGVNLETIPEWFDAGAACVGAGSALVKTSLMADKDWDGLTTLAGRFVETVRQAQFGGGL